MKAVILAAGKSTRTWPLTLTRPKPLLKIVDKTIIEHNLDQLNDLVDEVILVVGYKKEMIRKFIGDRYKNLKIKYVEQKRQLGSGHALNQTKIKERFLVLNGDDIFFREDLKKCLRHNYAVLTHKTDNTKDFGRVKVKNNVVKKIQEKSGKSNLVNAGLYVLDEKIFDMKIKKSTRGEYEITDMINKLAEKEKINNVVARNWLPIGYPWNLLEANVFFLKNLRKQIKGKIEKYVTIKGDVVIGKGTVVKSHTYIEGPVVIGENCVIGPHAYLRPDTTIGDNCRIRAEVIDSIIMDNTTAKHNSYIGHSVIGDNVNIAAGTVTADYRHDSKDHITIVKGKKVDAGRRKLGAFIGDNVSTGINTSIYPGRKIWPGKGTLPGEVVKKDIE